MAATSAIVLGVGTAVYNGVEANQQRQKAKGQTASVLAQRPDANALQQEANTAALAAQQKKRQQVATLGKQNSTILTGPGGVNAPPPPIKTLLGT